MHDQRHLSTTTIDYSLRKLFLFLGKPTHFNSITGKKLAVLSSIRVMAGYYLISMRK